MARAPREIWTPAKRNIIREWRDWAKKNPGSADHAFGRFWLHLERDSAELLKFSAENKFETVRDWLAQEMLINL